PMPSARHDAPANANELAGELERLLRAAVEKQLVADVPAGFFVSGGLDSSLVAALGADLQRPNTVRTFAVGFDVRSFDERPWARVLAGHIGARHVEIAPDAHTLVRALHETSAAMAEPIADPALLPT